MTAERRQIELQRYWPGLMLVTDRSRLRGRQVADIVDAAIHGGVNLVQLRERDLPSEELLAIAADLRDVTAGRALLLVNGDVDVALDAPADGVHLPESHSPIMTARSRVGERMLISRAVHSAEAAAAAEREGADMLVLGTIFPSSSHPGAATIGLEGVRAVCGSARISVLGIGGVTARNAGEVILAGASGVAVIGAVFDARDPRTAAAELRAKIDAVWNASRRATASLHAGRSRPAWSPH